MRSWRVAGGWRVADAFVRSVHDEEGGQAAGLGFRVLYREQTASSTLQADLMAAAGSHAAGSDRSLNYSTAHTLPHTWSVRSRTHGQVGGCYSSLHELPSL